MSTRKTTSRTSGKANAPADKEAAATTEETKATLEVATVATTQPEQEPAAAGEDKEADKAAKVATVLVISAPRSRRRAGLAFGPAPVRIPPEDLTDDQRVAIDSDPVLSVRVERA